MAQGFKPAKRTPVASGKAKSSGSSSKQGPKVGRKVIAPRRAVAVQQANAKKRQSASLTSRVEQEMAGRAAGGGPLTIMKKAADGAAAVEAKKKEKAAKKQR